MSSSEDEEIVNRRNLSSSKRLVSDEEDSEFDSRLPGRAVNNEVKNICNAIDPDSLTSDSSESSVNGKSGRSISSRKSSQSSNTSTKRSSSNSPGSRKSSPITSQARSSRSSGSDENDMTVADSQKSSQSVFYPSQRSSRSDKSQSPNSSPCSQSTKFHNSPRSQRNSSTSDSDEGVTASRKLKPSKFLESDEYDSDSNAVNKPSETDEQNAIVSEEPKARSPAKKRKRRLVMNSDSDGSNNENDTISTTIQTTPDEEKHEEPENPNLTAKEKRKKRLEKLNKQKMSEFAKLAERKKSHNSKKNEVQSQTSANNEQSHVQDGPTKPKKFLLLSDDDLSDDEGSGKSLEESENDNYGKEKQGKTSKRKSNAETKSRKPRKRKNQETEVNDTEETSSTKKEKKPRSRAPKEPKESKRKSKKQQEAMLEIKSTTQRMIREGRVALPYHQPKQRSLDEFLQRKTNVPSIPLRASYDIKTIVQEHLSKKEEEIAEFYKSESDHSEAEPAIDNSENNETSHQNDCETNTLEQIAANLANCDNFATECDTSKIDSVNDSKLESLENFSPAERDISNMNTAEMNSPDLGKNELEMNTNDHQQTNEGVSDPDPSTAAADPNFAKTVESDPSVDRDSVSALREKVTVLEEATKSVAEEHDVHEDILESIELPEETGHVENEESILNHRSELVNEDEDIAPAQDTEDFLLEIENSCPTEANSESCTALPVDPPPQIDPETIRRKKLELLSSRNVTLSAPKLKKEGDSVLQFEIDSLPESTGIRSFMEKFASHVTAKKKTKKQPSKINVTNVQTDSQGEIVDIIKETLTLKSLNDVEDDAKDKFILPGSKYSFFKDTMLKTLISKKTANWEKYQDEKYSLFDRDGRESKDIEDEDEEEELGIREPSFDPYHPEDEPDDGDLVEDDIDMSAERNRRKNEFLDEEAEVDYDEDENIMGENDEDADSDEASGVEDEGTEDNDREKRDEKEPRTNATNTDEEEVDSDEELLNNFLKESGQKESTEKEIRTQPKLFKNNITGEDLENKVLRLDSGSQLDDFSNTQVFSVCSGRFATQIVPPAPNESSQFFADSQFPDDSQGFNLSMQETNDGFQARCDKTSNDVSKNSFLLSDESDTEEMFNKKRKAIQLQDSDDDESAKPDNEETEELENEDDENDNIEEDNEGEDDLDEELGYNSEEEIIDYKKTFKPTEFFENEAELSESEWGSEDENEKDMDYMEKEAGDEDDIDQDRLKEELGRIHMRHLMDDDQKDVRYLQEILLEDGDLHADGQRSRKFQWKNLNGDAFLKNFLGDSDDENVLMDDNNLNDDEKSKNWRQMRHEREMFLSKQEKNNDLLLSAEDEKSSFIRISSTAKVTTKVAVTEGLAKPMALKSPSAKFSLHTKSKCGSFLSRGQQLLNRIASTVGESKENNTRSAKNSRNFVFAAKTVEEVDLNATTAEIQVEKRKISSKSVMARKRLKLIDGASNKTAPLRPGFLAQLSLSD